MIPLYYCKKGTVYRLQSRNLTVGVFDGKDGFIGIREKFGSRYLFKEYHYEIGAPYGTAKPLEILEIAINEELVEGYSGCVNCGGVGTTGYVRYAEPIFIQSKNHNCPGQWICLNCVDPIPVRRPNKSLFSTLERIENPQTERLTMRNRSNVRSWAKSIMSLDDWNRIQAAAYNSFSGDERAAERFREDTGYSPRHIAEDPR